MPEEASQKLSGFCFRGRVVITAAAWVTVDDTRRPSQLSSISFRRSTILSAFESRRAYRLFQVS
jgi:hypothetical protein